MSADNPAILSGLLCFRCDYDLRAHAQDGKCPECGASVEESRRVAAIPRRPAWRDSDPRWRRRVLAGIWVLMLLPLVHLLVANGWTARIPVPTVFDTRGAICTLEDTLAGNVIVYQPLIFCVGIVLLFAKERGRRHGRFDWTRRWGVICSYVILLLCACGVFFISSLILAGISASFMSLPLRHQVPVERLFVNLSTGYLRHGPSPKYISIAVATAFSSFAILFACVALSDALRSCGSKRVGQILLGLLACFAFLHIAQAGQYAINGSYATANDVIRYELYFSPDILVNYVAGLPAGLIISPPKARDFGIEVAKWLAVFAIAVRLTLAQIRTVWRQFIQQPYRRCVR